MRHNGMKLGFIVMLMGYLFLFAPAAKAEYAVSYWTHRHGRKYVIYRHINNYGHYPHGYYYWPASKERLGISDIILLCKAGVSDDVIIQKIVSTGAVFTLTVEEVEALRREGVSARVVNFMLNRKR